MSNLISSLHLLLVFALISFLVYSIMALFLRGVWSKKYDNKLNVVTTGLRSWGKGSLYNRTESTPYLALIGFSKKYSMSPKDGLVDFGCGKGRVAIFLHDKYKVPTTGIELNDLTFDEATENVESYLKANNANSVNSGIKIEKEYAEEYVIKKHENKFFFFNPFDVSIFKKVVSNIIEDAIYSNKEVELIVYYPIKSYREFLENNTQFKLSNKIVAQGAIGFTEKFLIYTFNPKDLT